MYVSLIYVNEVYDYGVCMGTFWTPKLAFDFFIYYQR
jgi:hypothetical protein